ncbi:MAG: hypothetical protein Tsb005_08680 [Gammaproteobacteria bacterium]
MNKSNLPNLEEVKRFSFKFLGDIKRSLEEIYQDYKSTREDNNQQTETRQSKTDSQPVQNSHATQQKKTSRAKSKDNPQKNE